MNVVKTHAEIRAELEAAGVRNLPYAGDLDSKLEELFAIRPSLEGWSLDEYYRACEVVKGIELVSGRVEFLPMPLVRHGNVISTIFVAFAVAIQTRGIGRVYTSDIVLKIEGRRNGRKPDLTVVLNKNLSAHDGEAFSTADLVVEVVSPDDPDRDLVEKRRDYAAAGIPEYWIANPIDGSLTVLVLDGDAYREHAKATAGVIESATIEGVGVDVDAVLGRFLRDDD